MSEEKIAEKVSKVSKRRNTVKTLIERTKQEPEGGEDGFKVRRCR